jgi:hypothetical protein
MSHVHLARGPDLLCGAVAARSTTTDPEAVTCPLCLALLAGESLAHRVVDGVQRRVTGKLAALQRDPAVRALAMFARDIVLADRANRGEGPRR